MSVLSGEASSESFHVQTADGRPAGAHEAIFPLLTQDVASGLFELIGTAFFIAESGVFATARHVVTHVLNDRGEPVKPLYLFQFLPSNTYVLRPVHRVTRHDTDDVAVGVAWPMTHNTLGTPIPNKLLTLAARPADIGLRISTYAYPKTRIQAGSPQRLEFDGAFFDGAIVEGFPQGRDRTLLPGPCFRTSMVLHGGASGGPVFGRGTVVAINSTGIGEEPISYVSCISSILGLSLPGIIVPAISPEPQTVTIARLMELGFVLSC